MGWNPFNFGNLRGNKPWKSKSVGIESYDHFDGEGNPVRVHRGTRHRQTARPKGDGFDYLRISLADIKRENRKKRNLVNAYRTAEGQEESTLNIVVAQRRVDRDREWVSVGPFQMAGPFPF